MKIAVISDIHMGFGSETERQEDPYKAFSEALEKSLDSDLIILPGDIFDSRTPNADVLTRAMELLQKPMLTESRTEVVSKHQLLKKGIPVIAIHGTHERRVKDLLNPVQALERAGFLIYLHCNTVILEKGGEKIAIHGMSTVPDQYGETVLKEWNPKPIDGCFNILVTHQSIAPFLYAPYLIPLESLPRGFDLYINGHIHGSKKVEYAGAPFIIPGSLVPTQITKDLTKHSFCKIETENGKIKYIDFIELENQRKIFYKEFEKEASLVEIEDYLKQIAEEKHALKPIVKLIVSNKTLPMNELVNKFQDKIILYYKKDVDEEKIEVKTIEERVESVQELSKKLLRQNLQNLNLDNKRFEMIFELLAEGKKEKVIELLEKGE